MNTIPRFPFLAEIGVDGNYVKLDFQLCTSTKQGCCLVDSNFKKFTSTQMFVSDVMTFLLGRTRAEMN